MSAERDGLARARRVSRLIDQAIAAKRSMPGKMPGVGPVQSVPDAELMATLVAHGMPFVSARAVEHLPQMRFVALRFWADVEDSARGDLAARERVDLARSRWVQLRRDELIAEDPRRITV